MKQVRPRLGEIELEVLLEALSIGKASLNSQSRSTEFKIAYQQLWIKFGGLDL